ncbi:ElyC/SanA/YdcF family protein [Mariniluteicoccus endophyticus]
MSVRRRLAIGAVSVVGLAVAGVGVPWLVVQGYAAGRTHHSAAQAPQRDVALVLGAQIYPDGTPSPFLKGRLDMALDLYRAGKVKVVVVSGDNGEEHYNEPDGMRNYLIRHGIPASKVVADYAGFDTYDSCVRAKRIFGVERLTIVTQDYHVPRAVATCRMVGVDAIGAGDTSQHGTRFYPIGRAREVPANLKTFWDVLSRRTPTLGPHETGVEDALRS